MIVYSKELVIETKLFTLMKEGSLLRIIERGWKFKNEVQLGHATIQWLRRALDDCSKGERRDFYSLTGEGFHSFIAQR